MFHEYDFGTHKQPKFCVVMEECPPNAQSVLIAFTTSNPVARRYSSSVFIADLEFPPIPGDTCLQCNNYKDVPCSLIFSDKTKYLGVLPDALVARIDEALEFLAVPEEIMLRMLPP